MAASTTLSFDIFAYDRASGTFHKVGSASQSAGKKIGGISDKFRSFAKAAAFAGIAAAGFAVKLGVDAIGAASDLNETLSKSKVIFGDAQKQVEKFADGAAKNLGQSKQQALDAAATFGVFGKSAGLSGADLAKFSTNLTGLSSDMASFSNTTPEEAIEAIGSALRGEAEPIRKFGVLLDDATLRAQAMKMGLIETTTQALTPQQKVLAAHAVILKQTKDAQGDFARTSDGLANQQRILKAQFEDTSAAIGQKLLPMAVKVVTWINDEMIPGATKLYSWLKSKLGPVFAEVGEFIDRFRSKGGEASDIMARLREVVGTVKAALKDAQPFFDFLKGAAENLGVVIREVLWPAFKKLSAWLYGNGLEGLRNFGKALGVVGRLGIAMWNNALMPVFKFMAAAIGTVLEKLGMMFSALGSIKGAPDWIGKTGKALQDAAAKANAVADGLKRIDMTNPTVDITYRYHHVGQVGTNAGNIDLQAPSPRTATGGRPSGRQSGRMVQERGGRMATAGGSDVTTLAAAMRAALDGLTVNINGDGTATFLLTGASYA